MGRDYGFYYRTWGAELRGEKDYGLITSWRLFGEQHFDATVHTEFALAHPGGVKGDLTNINAVNGNIIGLALAHHSSYGVDPHAFRALTDIKLEGAAGTFDYTRGLLQTTLSHGLGPLDWALTLGSGTSGGQLPIQKQFFIGSTQTVRGQKAGAAIGDSFWLTSAEIGSRSTGFRKIVFADLGWAGSRSDFSHPGRPLSGAGVGASFMDGLIRVDLAKGIYPKNRALVGRGSVGASTSIPVYRGGLPSPLRSLRSPTRAPLALSALVQRSGNAASSPVAPSRLGSTFSTDLQEFAHERTAAAARSTR